MQTVEKIQDETGVFGKIKFEANEAINCLQVKAKLDKLFSGDARLEETHVAVKTRLFKHLETCPDCCRVFDARVRFRTPGRNRIF